MSPRTAEAVWNSAKARNASLTAVVVGSLNIAAALAFIVSSITGPVGPNDEWAFAPSFVLIFPLWGWAVVLLIARQSRTARNTGAPTAETGRYQAFLGFLLVAALCGAVSAIASVPAIAGGQPHFDATSGQYTLNNHGSFTVVSHSTYVRAVAGQMRLFLGGTLIFCTVAVAIAAGHLHSRRTTFSSTSPASSY
ncbi:MAG TPA: hypothetical protein VHO29_10850 [Marmoricola sp.]|nr:hypothetical protein [Marmoricola sp.]